MGFWKSVGSIDVAYVGYAGTLCLVCPKHVPGEEGVGGVYEKEEGRVRDFPMACDRLLFTIYFASGFVDVWDISEIPGRTISERSPYASAGTAVG